MESDFSPKIKAGPCPIWLALITVTLGLSAADPQPQPGEMPRSKPLETNAALESFRVRDGFKIHLAAAEPLVADPMAIAFDERGRLYVVEMHGYPEKRHAKIGKVRLLTDTDGDGLFDTSTVFAQGLGWPSAIIAYDGGVFVGCAPDIYFMRDNNGDGVADEKRTVFTGFRTGSPREIAPRLFNSFRWGYDNRIYAASSMNGGIVRRPEQPESAAINLTRHDFSFNPRTLDLRAESGTAQHGMSFDLRGNRFASRNSNHIQAMVYDWRYADRNPAYTLPHWKQDIAVEGPSAMIYRISPPEPWRVLRTRWRVGGAISGPVEGGGTAFGYFTSATGITIYRGDAFPTSFIGNAFIGAPANNLIHRKHLSFTGAEPVARRADPNRKNEFLASTDNWFRPVQFANSPDGCLYVADMYRETIEVAHAIPETIKAHLDIYSGTDRGRIYRIAPDDFKQPNLPNLDQINLRELVANLASPNGWHRDTAARLIFERQSPEMPELVRDMISSTKTFPAKIHSLYLLEGAKALTLADLQTALADNTAAVREHALRLFERRLNNSTADTLLPMVGKLVEDPDPRVRMQLAFTLGKTSRLRSTVLLAGLGRHEENDRWINAAILSSLTGRIGDFLAGMIANGVHLAPFEVNDIMASAIEISGTTKDANGIAAAITLIKKGATARDKFRATLALGTGLRRAKSDFAKFDSDGIVKRLLLQARAAAMGEDDGIRTNAIACLTFADFEQVDQTLYSLLDQQHPQTVQLTALNTLDQFSAGPIAPEIIRRWQSFTPAVRNEAMRVLLRRTSHTLALLLAIERGTMMPSDIPFNRRASLPRHRDKQIQSAAKRILGQQTLSSRADALKKFRPALRLTGIPTAGRKVYEERCQTCHAFKATGHQLGPDLETVRAWTAEEILLHVIDPNLKVEPNQRAYTVDTNEDESFTGLILSESTTGVTIRMPNSLERRVSRKDIKTIQGSGLSLMPAGLEESLLPQGMADLIAFLKN